MKQGKREEQRREKARRRWRPREKWPSGGERENRLERKTRRQVHQRGLGLSLLSRREGCGGDVIVFPRMHSPGRVDVSVDMCVSMSVDA